MLGTDQLTWRDLWVIVRQSPRGSALDRAHRGEASTWGSAEYLLAIIVDLLAGANYQRGSGKGKRPKPIKRPTDKSRRPARQNLNIRQIADRMGWETP